VVGNVGVSGGGRFYYEVQLQSNQQILVGFVAKGCSLDVNNTNGLGSNDKSWGFDGYNGQKCSSGKTEKFGESYWQKNDIIGVLYDLDQRKVFISRNGKSMGACFTGMPKSEVLFPACSLRRYQKVTFNFGAKSYKFPDKMAYPYHLVLSAKQKEGIEKLFEHYQKIGIELSESQEDRGDVISADGVFQFATDAGAKDDSDPLLLIIAYKLSGEHPWEFSRDEWVRGFSLNGLHDIVGIKKVAGQWKKDIFADADAFKLFYNWCFDYLREDRKILSMEETKTLWSMLDMTSRWTLWGKWIEFLEKKKRKYLSRDEWCVVLTFSKEKIEDYDEDGAWPSLVDDFVDFYNGVDEDED
jgi:DCN1-like protein 4/5